MLSTKVMTVAQLMNHDASASSGFGGCRIHRAQYLLTRHHDDDTSIGGKCDPFRVLGRLQEVGCECLSLSAVALDRRGVVHTDNQALDTLKVDEGMGLNQPRPK